MFATAHFGGTANPQAVHTSDARVATDSLMVNKGATSRRG
jgi:hypothetical protein